MTQYGLTHGQYLQARRIKANNPKFTARQIAYAVGVSERQIAKALDLPTAYRPKRKPKPFFKTATNNDPYGRVAAGIVEAPSVKVPHDVLLERERRMAMSPRSLTAALFGDPLPGYSVLDKRQGA